MNDVACDIDGLAFSNFVTTLSRDIEKTNPQAASLAALSTILSTGTTTLQTTSLHTTTVLAPSPDGAKARRIWDPEAFDIPRYTDLDPASNPASPVSELEKRADGASPYFLLGIPVPSQQLQNLSAISGAGSGDPGTMSAIITQARSIPRFRGVFLWGGVVDMEVGQENGYLGFIKRLLGSIGRVIAPVPSASSIVGSEEGGSIMVTWTATGQHCGWGRPCDTSGQCRAGV